MIHSIRLMGTYLQTDTPTPATHCLHLLLKLGEQVTKSVLLAIIDPQSDRVDTKLHKLLLTDPQINKIYII